MANQDFRTADLLYVYVHRDAFQNVAQILTQMSGRNISAVAMAAGVTSEAQNILTGHGLTPGGAVGVLLNQMLDQRVSAMSHAQISALYDRFYVNSTPEDFQGRRVG